jgi:hypothetical protein
MFPAWCSHTMASGADAYGRPPPEREAWRDSDRGGYATRGHPPVASRSAAIASYAGRSGPSKRPDDPERVRRTVFVDNVETHYNEEVGLRCSHCTAVDVLAAHTALGRMSHQLLLSFVTDLLMAWLFGSLLQSIAVFFSRLGTVTKVRLGPDSHGVRRAWAEFEKEDQAKLALQYDQQVRHMHSPPSAHPAVHF